jgi:secreted Zn-dependent insulinase-like peptidase
LIFNLQMDFKDRYLDFTSIGFKFLLTEHGLKNVDLIIRLLSRYIQLFHKNIYNKSLFDFIQQNNNKNFFSKAKTKNAYQSLKKWTKNFFLYGKDEFLTADNLLKQNNPHLLHGYIKNMTLHNSIIFIGARSFKHFNDTYLYKVLHKVNPTQEKNYTESQFLSNKEKWYKTKWTEYKLDEDDIWHIFKRSLKDSRMFLPEFNFNLTSNKAKSNSLCYNEKGKKIPKKDCVKLFKNDRKNILPNLIYNQTGENISETIRHEIYHKLDRTHLKKSFSLRMKISPVSNLINLKDEKTLPYLKFLTIYLNFLIPEIKLSEFPDNYHNNKVSLKFLDNYHKPTDLFYWKNSKEKLRPEDYMVDSIYLQIDASSLEDFEKSNTLQILKSVLKKKIDYKDFLYLKEELYRIIEFYKSSNPSHQAINWLYRLGFKWDINYFNMTHSIRHISLDGINSFKDNLFENLNIKSLAVGSISDEKAKEFLLNFQSLFIYDEKKENQISGQVKQSFMQAPHTKWGSHFIFQKNNLFKHSPDSTTLNAYFLGENSIHNQACMKMIKAIAGNIFFSYLRIKHQLGYSVKNKILNIDNNLLFLVHVQGSKKHPSKVQYYIERVIPKIKVKIRALDEKSFKQLKEKMSEKMQKIKTDLNIKSHFYWSVIMSQDTIFSRKAIRDFFDTLTQFDLEKFIDKLLVKRLSIQVANSISNYEKIDKESIYITDLDYFRRFANYDEVRVSPGELEQIKPKLSMRLNMRPFKNINLPNNK